MKILIVAGTFPPYCPASASRVNKLARYLEEQGKDVQVLSPRNTEYSPVLVPEVGPDRIHYTAYTSINAFPNKFQARVRALLGRPSQGQSETPAPKEKTRRKESMISLLYRRLTNIPDDLVGWYLPAVREGRILFETWQPDIIFATSPPFTTMMVANRLGRMIAVPVVNDYRDLWTDHPYYDSGAFRKIIDRILENYALKHCAGLVTVTQTWARYLQQIRPMPVEFVMNGFDPADFDNQAPEKEKKQDKTPITLLYAGYLYGNKRDPSVLFEALGRMGKAAADFRVLFYTPKGQADLSDDQQALITRYGLENIVSCHGYIPQKELLALQQTVDILVLLRWDHPSEDGVIAGKLFEYIGANKPILSLGSTTGEAADIIRDNDFGLVSNDADDIAAYLTARRDQKHQASDTLLADFNRENPNRQKFTRQRQFEKLVTFLEKIVAAHALKTDQESAPEKE